MTNIIIIELPKDKDLADLTQYELDNLFYDTNTTTSTVSAE